MKPLLAATLESMADARFPVLASPKLDGIRCLVIGGAAVSRSLKPIPNAHVRAVLADLPDLDGELIAGDPCAPSCFTDSTSAVMSRDGAPVFTFHVFDRLNDSRPFADRLASLAGLNHPAVRVVPHVLIHDGDGLARFEAESVAAGYEGVMIRDPAGPYKHGRSTFREGVLLKVKRFTDDDAAVIGFEELQHNENAATVGALGHTERSTAKAGLRAGGTLGALICRAPGWSEPFRVGTGFSAAARSEIWAQRATLPGRLVKFKHQAAGASVAPRFPVFLGFRAVSDT